MRVAGDAVRRLRRFPQIEILAVAGHAQSAQSADKNAKRRQAAALQISGRRLRLTSAGGLRKRLPYKTSAAIRS